MAASNRTIPMSEVIAIARELVDEAYVGPQAHGSWFTSTSADAGLVGTLAGLSADAASRPSRPGGPSIAAHVEHLRWSLANVNATIRGAAWQPDWSAKSFDAPPGFDAFAVVARSIAETPFTGSIVCRVRLAVDIETARGHLPPDAVVLEPVEGGVLLSVRAHPDDLDRIALHLLRLPFAIEPLEPEALLDALRRVGDKALRLADSAHHG